MPRYRLAIADVLREAGLDTTYKIVQKMGKPPAQASRLLDPKRTQVNIDVINEVCEFTGRTPGDLFVRVDEKSGKKKR